MAFVTHSSHHTLFPTSTFTVKGRTIGTPPRSEWEGLEIQIPKHHLLIFPMKHSFHLTYWYMEGPASISFCIHFLTHLKSNFPLYLPLSSFNKTKQKHLFPYCLTSHSCSLSAGCNVSPKLHYAHIYWNIQTIDTKLFYGCTITSNRKYLDVLCIRYTIHCSSAFGVF